MLLQTYARRPSVLAHLQSLYLRTEKDQVQMRTFSVTSKMPAFKQSCVTIATALLAAVALVFRSVRCYLFAVIFMVTSLYKFRTSRVMNHIGMMNLPLACWHTSAVGERGSPGCAGLDLDCRELFSGIVGASEGFISAALQQH